MVISSIYEQAVDKFGKTHQIGVLIEEMGECIAKGSQLITRGRDVEQEFIEEIADVQIMINQMEVVYGKERINTAIRKKLTKLQGYLDD